MKICLASDHRGFAAKSRLLAMLKEKGHEVRDFGTDSDASCDYPDLGGPAAKIIALGECDVGIFLCGTGIGMSITANKVPGIRAALCHDELTAEVSRRHNNANVLCLPADLLGDDQMRRIVEVWLSTPFDGGRHARRIKKLEDIERDACETVLAPKPKP
ncbi:MAG: putative sugar phosphate isomerase YwlF [Phycisphaerae bacterium]|nr:putative sugar phosphate isomerase YwlF [Phycisphaerae bacterium]